MPRYIDAKIELQRPEKPKNNILKIKRRPVELEAIQLEKGREVDVLHFITKDLPFVIIERDGIKIKTLEGDHLVQYGDYIIEGIGGDFHPCKPDVFHRIYKVIGDEENDEN